MTEGQCTLFDLPPKFLLAFVFTQVGGLDRSSFGCTGGGWLWTGPPRPGLAHPGQSLTSIPTNFLWSQFGPDFKGVL